MQATRSQGRHSQDLEIGEQGVGVWDRPVGIDGGKLPAQEEGQGQEHWREPVQHICWLMGYCGRINTHPRQAARGKGQA